MGGDALRPIPLFGVRTMKLFQKLLLAPAALGLMAPMAASAADLNVAGVRQYTTSEEQVTSITQFSDVKPTDWAYQALSNLIERYGCVAGYPSGTYKGGQAMTRYEAAALLNACLDRVTEVTDEVKRLVKEFEKELAVLKGRVDSLEAKVGELEATQFSTTTKLKGQTTFVLGATSFYGTYLNSRDAYQTNAAGSIPVTPAFAALNYGATTFNYDLRLHLDTSFTGKDLLRTTLRSGNFGQSAYGQPSLLFLEAASSTGNTVIVDRLFYSFPMGSELIISAGPRVSIDDPGMVGIWPSIYPSDTVLDFFTIAGSPTAYNKATIGGGIGFVYSPKFIKGLNFSQNYVSTNANSGNPRAGGLFTTGAASTAISQLAYTGSNTPLIGGSYAIAGAYTFSQNQGPAVSTPLASIAGNAGANTLALSGYWKPAASGFVPSVSWGVSTTAYKTRGELHNTVTSTWYTGLQWDDAFIKGNAAGMAVGQAPMVTYGANNVGCPQNGVKHPCAPNDSNYVWEWWYKFQVTDNISVTPAIYYISNFLGQEGRQAINPSKNADYNAFGGLIKTTFKF